MDLRRASVAVGVLAAAMLLAPGSASARTLRPTRLDDPAPDGCKTEDCSLREAVLAANKRAGADVIELRSGKTYTLAIAGNLEDEGKTGDLDVTGPTSFRPTGKGRATIDAGGIDRVLDFLAHGELRRLKITGGANIGSVNFDDGGGIRAVDDPVDIVDSLVTGNGDETSTRSGGGVGLLGGGSIVGSEFTDNASKSAGGGAFVKGSGGDRFAVRDSTFKDNGSKDGLGGGLAATRATVARARILDNESAACAGVALDVAALTNSVVAQNTVTGSFFGGGVCAVGNGGSTISDSRILGNRAGSAGGGIYSSSDELTIERSTIAGNSAELDDSEAGGIEVSSSEARLVRSTVSGNASEQAAGVLADRGAQLTVASSTIAGNAASSGTGGLVATGEFDVPTHVDLSFSTISANTGTGAGGISADAPAGVSSLGTIIAGNASSFTAFANCQAAVESEGHNLIGTSTGCGGFDEPSDQTGEDAMLGPLTDNGGATETLKPKAASPAIDAGGRQCPKTDQRGVKRPKGGRCDVGSVEAR